MEVALGARLMTYLFCDIMYIGSGLTKPFIFALRSIKRRCMRNDAGLRAVCKAEFRVTKSYYATIPIVRNSLRDSVKLDLCSCGVISEHFLTIYSPHRDFRVVFLTGGCLCLLWFEYTSSSLS